MLNTEQFAGKVAFITGAASGIGAACARRFYEVGMNVVLVDLSADALHIVAANMSMDRVLLADCSVTDRQRLNEIVAETRARFGKIDFVFANAGIACDPPCTLRAIDENTFEGIVEVNLLGVWRTIRACLPSIVESGGYILATSSIYAFVNGVANIPYAASKAGVEMMMRSLRVELVGLGATAGVLMPGWIRTPIAASALGKHPIAGAMVRLVYPKFLRSPIEPEMVAEKVLCAVWKRPHRVVVPSRWAPVSVMRGVVNIFTDHILQHHAKLHRLLRDLEKEVMEHSRARK